MNKYKLKGCLRLLLWLLPVFVIGLQPSSKVSAETATAVTIGAIDYEELTLQVYSNNNSIIYYSTDETTWTEVEGSYSTGTKSYIMDISWVSITSDVTLYFKGDVNTTIKSTTLPMQDKSFKVTYSKADEEFNFVEADDYDYFEWRKTSDYSWNTVSLNDASSSYKQFISSLESFRLKGAKIIIRLPQVKGSGSNAGSRPSKEITISITARAEAPKVTVNSSKLTLNTTESMEYYDASTGTWIECSKTMTLEEIAPSVLYKNGAHSLTLLIRTAATASSSYSKTAYVTINGQKKAPAIGGNVDDLSYYFYNSKLVMTFNNATKTSIFEYTIVKPGSEFNATSAKWTSISSAKLITLSSTTAPKGSKVYIRKKGVDASSTKGTELILSSAVSNFSISY